MVTVVVNYVNLLSAISKMSLVRQRVSSRKLDVTLEASKGDFAEELMVLTRKLEENGKAFAAIAEKTENVLRAAKLEFAQIDQLAAGQFRGSSQTSGR